MQTCLQHNLPLLETEANLTRKSVSQLLLKTLLFQLFHFSAVTLKKMK